MFVTSGAYKGAKLSLASGSPARPTGSKVRMALFNILHREVQNSSWLDLFAGSGIIGIEALSRGASHVSFVDNNPKTAKQLQDNCQRIIGNKGGYQVIRSDVQRVSATQLGMATMSFIYADPPYQDIIKWLPWFEKNIPLFLCPSGVFILETAQKVHEEIGQILVKKDSLHLDKKKIYGHTALTFLKKTDNKP